MTRIHERPSEMVPASEKGRAEPNRNTEKPIHRGRTVPIENRNGILERVRGLLSGDGGSLALENEDLMLLLILYLMYRESGDREFLIVLAAMLFL